MAEEGSFNFKEIIYDKQWYDYTALLMINRPHRLNAYTLNTFCLLYTSPSPRDRG